MQEPDGRQSHAYDDEISLYELWDVLVRRLPVLLTVGALTIVSGVVYAVMQPLMYEYRSGVDLPTVYAEESVNVVSQEMAIAWLEDVLVPLHRRELFDGKQEIPDVHVSEHGSGFSLMLESTSTREAAHRVSDLHQEIIAELSVWLDPRFERFLSSTLKPLNNRIDVLDEQIETLGDELQLLYERLGDGDDVAGLIVAQQIGDVRRELSSLRSDRADAQSKAETVQEMSRNTEQTFIAAESEDPVGPGRSLIVALSVVLGGMFGLFAAFFWEFVSNARRRHVDEN
ncbi:hypothetical protein [Thioalkalivibrio sp. ALJ2]|uniref:hypothetical protein n=1 Tax=Thioalkalivibrio sp. ALJ2 TaxID=1261622 RepID=UPI00037DE7DE|nr:hypothetical protein [Thioalkalivibrio sp. ALJ2]